jgi:xanthosine phosphorylase
VSDGRAAAEVIAGRGGAPRLGIVLGSGLGGIADALADAVAIPYGELPGFPLPGVAGHGGRLVLGTLEGLPVACLQGRRHVYEGPVRPGESPAAGMAVPVRALRAAGAEALLVTNAAGSLRAENGPGSLMAIADHINLLGANPLTGPNDDAIGPRFPSLAGAYDAELRAHLQSAARREGIELPEGVYLATAGPSFETPAEIRAFRTLGADAVGMSTVPEVILARHSGMRVAAVSAITNLAEGMGGEPLSHEQTLRFAGIAAEDLVRLIAAFCQELA